MCGGIVSFLAAGAGQKEHEPRSGRATILLAYNLGRIFSYTVAGLAAGATGAVIGRVMPGPTFHAVALLVSACFMLGLATYLAGLRSFLPYIENLGARLWKHIEPAGRKLFPVTGPVRAAGLGVIWGWLPCGLVYTALAWSIASGSAIRGGTLMLGFGLGTLPTLLVIGSGALDLKSIASRPLVRYAIGALMFVLAMYMLFSGVHILQNDPGTTHSHMR